MPPGSSASGWGVFPALTLQEREAPGKRSTFCTQIAIHREFPAGSTDCSHRAGFSMLKELYLSPEIKLKAKAGLRASIVCPYSKLRNKFSGVLDFRKNLKRCFEGHKRMSLSA